MRKGSKRSCLRKTTCVPNNARKVRFQEVEAYHLSPGKRLDDAACLEERSMILSSSQDDPLCISPMEAVQVAECWHIELAFEDAFECLHRAHADNSSLPRPVPPRSCLHDDGEIWRIATSNDATLPVEAPTPSAWLSSRPIVTPSTHEPAPETTDVSDQPEGQHEPVPVRDRPSIWVIPPWRRRLNEAIQAIEPNPEDETRQPRIDIWFLDHERHRRCDAPRVAYLNSQPSLWRRQIVEMWDDLVDRTVGHMIHVCYPAEPVRDQKIADVILVQRSQYRMSSVLVSLHADGGLRKWAKILPNVMDKNAVLRAIEMQDVVGDPATFPAHDMRIGLNSMRDDVPFPVTQGLHFHIHVRRTVNLEDEMVLMQQSSHVNPPDAHWTRDSSPMPQPYFPRPLSPSVSPVEAPTTWLSSRAKPVFQTVANWRTQPTITVRHTPPPGQLPGTREIDAPDDHVDMDLQDEYYLNTLRRIRRAHDPGYVATLRTWYIQHRHCEQWSDPRVLPYHEDDRTLEDDIFALWRDQLDRTLDEVLFTVVYPDASGPSDSLQPMADLILSQGLQHPESAVLVSIQQIPENEIQSLCAYSMPHHPTGREFLTRIQMEDPCDLHTCMLWYVDELIPLTDAPFATDDGQAFVLQITKDHDIELAETEGIHHHPMLIHNEAFARNAEQQFATTQGVWIHRLHFSPVFHHVRWTDSRTLLLDCARACGVPIHEAVAVHHVECQVEGQSDWEHSVIVQTVQDFVPGVTDRLILIDVNLHVGEGVPFPIPPTVIRKVVRAQPMATREHLLHYTMTSAFCQLQGNRCIVKHNGQLWPHQNIALRRLSHGDYVQIHLPPPSANFHEITLHELMEIDSYGQYAHEHVAPGWSFDATALLQTNINVHQTAEMRDEPLRHLQCRALSCFRRMAQWIHDDVEDAALVMMQSSASVAVTDEPVPAPVQNIDDQTFFTQMLHTAWHPASEKLCGETDRHATVQTWFVDFLNAQRCTQPRAVTLYEDFAQWETTIERAWADMIDPSEPVDLYHVLPVPPDIQSPLCAHVIVCQRAHVHKRAVMVSVYTRGNHMYRSVGLVDASTSEWDLQVVANLGYECTIGALRDRCTCFFSSTAFTPSTMWQTYNGMHFYILVDATDIPVVDPLAGEDALSLIQTLQHAPPQIDHHDTGAVMSLMQQTNPAHAPEVLAQCPLFIQELHTLWRNIARSVSDESPTATLQIWYLNFYGDHICRHPRAITLDDDVTTWDNRIAAACGTLLDPAQAYTYYRVHPQPFDRSLSLVAHVLVVQNDDRHRIPVLLTAYDRTDRLSLPQRVATFVSNPVGGDSILRTLALDDCLGRNPQTRCTIWHRNEALENVYTLVNPVPGDQFFVISQPMACPEPPTGQRKRPIIALNLLQTRAKMRPATSQPMHEDPVSHAEHQTWHLVTHESRQSQAEEPHPIWTKVNVGRVTFLRNCLHESLLPWGNQQWQAVPWKPCTRNLLENVSLWQGATPTQLHFYTDGSSKHGCTAAASAVFLMVETTHGWQYGGFHAFAPVISMSAQSAEHSAVFGATLWALHIVIQWQCQPTIHFCFDCYAAGFAAAGWWNSWVSPVASVTRGLVMWLEELTGPCQWHHTTAHDDNPGNEAADVISRQACHDLPKTCELDRLWKLCTFDENESWVCEWLWYLERILRHPTRHPRLDGDLLWFNTQPPLVDQPDATIHPYMRKMAAYSPPNAAWFHLAVGTANVLTLFPGDSATGRYTTSRMESLIKQFDIAGLDIIGMQETRCRQSGHYRLGSFHVLSSAATDRGLYGVKLLIRVHLVHGDLSISHGDLRILASTPRLLVASLQASTLRLLLIVAHAPSHGSLESPESFWKELDRNIPARCRGWTTIAMLDSNARVGSLCTSAVGPHQMEEQNESGETFHSWLLHNQLYLPQTFEGCHVGPACTWRHPKGTEARLDFVATSMDIALEDVTTMVDDTIDLETLRLDHRCVTARLWCPGVTTVPMSSSVPESAPSTSRPCTPSWDMNVHTHAAILQEHFYASASMRPNRPPRKPHLSDDTWALIQSKKKHFGLAKAAARSKRIGFLRALFQAWRHGQHCNDCLDWHRRCDRIVAWHSHQAASLAPKVRDATRRDDVRYYEELAAQTATVINDNPIKMWDAVRPMLPKTRKKREASLRCTGPTTLDRCQYYANLEAGTFDSYASALHQCHQGQLARCDEAPLELLLRDLPSRVQVERLCRRVRAGKAAGLDGISPEFWRDHGVEVAEQVSELMMKIWMTAAEPFQFKGGRLFSIGKRQASKRVEDLRGIMILDGVGKLYHSYLRSKFMETAQIWRQPMQLGGYVHQQTLFGTQYLRCLWKHSAAKRLSCAILFLDLKSAFHTLLREHLMGHSASLPPVLIRVLEEAGFDIELINSAASSHSTPFCADVPLPTQRVLQDAHVSTWFCIDGADQICLTTRGSRPGSPLADLAFNAFISHLIQELQSAINAIPAMQTAFSVLSTNAPILGWVDDIAIPMLATAADEMPSLIATVTQMVHCACRKRGLMLNFKPGKTEVVCSFRGPGSTLLKKEYMIEKQGHIQLTEPDVLLRMVGSYEHLGTQFSHSGSLVREINVRIGKACAAHRTIQRGILKNRRISVKARCRLLEALIIPVLLHGSGNWPMLNHRSFIKLQNVMITWIRSIANDGHWNPSQLTNVDLLAAWHLPDLKTRLNKSRLLYGFQLLEHGPQALLDQISATDSLGVHEWTHAVREAVKWIAALDEDLRVDNPLSMTIEAIFEWFSKHRHHGPNRVRRGFLRHKHLEHQMYATRMLHTELLTIAKQGGVAFDQEVQMEDSASRPFECGDCDATFSSLQHVAAHRWKKHGWVSDERMFCFDAVCRSCQKCLWTTQRLQQHLKASRHSPDGCYCRLTWWCRPLRQIAHVEKPERLHAFHRLPACRTLMPDLQPNQFESEADALHRIDQEWEWNDFPPVLLEDDKRLVYASIAGFFADMLTYEEDDSMTAFSPLLEMLHDLGPRCSHEDVPAWALCEWIKHDLSPAALSHLSTSAYTSLKKDLWSLLYDLPMGSLLAWRWRIEEAYIPMREVVHSPVSRQAPETTWCTYSQQLEMIEQLVGDAPCTFPSCKGVPVACFDGTPTLYVLHLFSGRRRRGDIHDWLEELAPIHVPGYRVVLLSMDTAVSEIHGNIDDGEAFTCAKNLCQHGAVAGVLTGPPCETWSAARHLVAPPGCAESWPRPIRDSSHPWSRLYVTAREGRQLAMGTKLMLHSWQLEVAVVLQGGGSIQEHPEEASDEAIASVWRTPTHRKLLMAAPDACRHVVEQWRYGSKGVKPTCLRALNLGDPAISARVLAETESVYPERPVQGLQGKDDSGRFRTAAAKEYPRDLCRAIAATWLTGIRHRISHEGVRLCTVQPAPEELSWLKALSEASGWVGQGSFLPDYQGT